MNHKNSNVQQIAINGYDRNFSYFVNDESTKDIAIVDPGDISLLEQIIDEGNWRPKMILLTHSHHDHVEAVAPLVAHYDIPVYLHENAMDRVDVPSRLIRLINDGTKIALGNLKIEVLYTPGHIDDAVCFYISAEQALDGTPKLLTGDTLFVEGCGRSDFPLSNPTDLKASLRRISQLPNNTEVFPGHDYGSKPISTIEWEKVQNRHMQIYR